MITKFLFIISCLSLINSESYPTILLHGIASSKEALYELEDSMNNYNIKTYNIEIGNGVFDSIFMDMNKQCKIFADEIIALMILPGIDMIRVASSRILRKKHAFEPDQNHLHHLLMKMYNEKISYFIIIGIILTKNKC